MEPLGTSVPRLGLLDADASEPTLVKSPSLLTPQAPNRYRSQRVDAKPNFAKLAWSKMRQGIKVQLFRLQGTQSFGLEFGVKERSKEWINSANSYPCHLWLKVKCLKVG